MKQTNSLWLSLTILVLGLSGCSNKPSAQTATLSGKDSVTCFILKTDTLHKAISFPGELTPIEKAEVFAKVSGYIKVLNADIGDIVRRGQIIAVLEAPEVISNYAQAYSDLESARSKYAGSLDTYRRLAEAAQTPGTVAPGELARTKTLMLADSSVCEALKSKLAASAELKDYLIVKAPFDGVITRRNVDLGTLVSATNTNPIFTIEKNDTLRLRLPVPEAYTASIPADSKVKFTTDAIASMQFEAVLSRRSGALNITNRTETWEFIYVNKDRKLKSGMFANATMKFGRNAPTFAVPSSAVATNLEKRFVIRVRSGKAEYVDVRNGVTVDSKTEIFGNLSEGDTLIMKATDEIKPGNEIVPKVSSK